jgi:hypothetical protein
MLHREADAQGSVDWRQISGLDKHGEYNHEIPADECRILARETKEYENAFLTQEISFLEFMQDYFNRHRLRHVQKVYDDRVRQLKKGTPVRVMVYSDGQLDEHRVTREG